MSLSIKKNKRRAAKARLEAALAMVLEAMESRVMLSFTPGNIAVLDLAAASTNTTGSIIELSPTAANQSAPVQTVGISATGANALRFSDSGTSSYLADSNDRTLLAFSGYNTTDSTTADLANTTVSDRAVGTLGGDTSFALQTTYTGVAGNQTRSATSTDDSHWYITDKGGLYSNGETSATLATNILSAKSFGGTVYVSSTKTAIPVNTVASPTATAVTALPGLPADTGIQDFYLVKSGNNGSNYDLLYTLDAAATGPIKKFALVSGSWTAEGSYTLPAGTTALSLIAAANGTTGASLYYTTSTTVVKLTDTAAYNTAMNVTTANNVTLYTTASGSTDFLKGIDFVPVAAVTGVAPSITTNPSDQTVPAGNSATFTAGGSGNPTPTVQWFKGGTPGTTGVAGTGTAIGGATSPTLTFTTSSTADDDGTTYYAEFTNSLGLQDTSAATLHDTLAAPLVTTQPLSVSTTIGSLVSFTSAASGSPVPFVQWQVSTNGGGSWSNDTTDSGNTTGTLSFTAAGNQNNNEYRAVFTNSQASANSNPATLSLGGTVITAWNFNTLNSSTAGATVFNPAPSTGTGTASSMGMSTPGIYTVDAHISTSGNYTLTVTDSSGTYATGTLAFNAAASTVQTALQALNPATTGSITVLAGNGSTLGITMTSDPTGVLTGSAGTLSSPSTFLVALPAYPDPVGDVNGVPVASDDSNILASSGSGNGGSTDGTAGNIWRIVGTNGWNSAAPIGTQGAQFLASTSGDSSITAQFDLYASTQGEGKFEVEYTTDGSTWNNVPAADLSIGANSASKISVQNNTSSANTVTGGYFDIVGGQNWYNALQVNLEGIPAVNNNANFGIRIVNSSTGADCLNAAGAALNNTSGNWRFDEVQIIGNNPAAPIITTQPANQFVSSGNTATFTAAATGFPAPSVQWKVSTDGGATFGNDTTDAGNTTGTLSVVASAANSGDEYEAVFTNTVGSTPTTAATLSTGPVITTQPISQQVSAGASVSLIAAASGTPTPTVQWQLSTNGGASFSNISGATSATYTFTALEGATGNEYQAVFTNSGGSVTTSPATLTVLGTPITQWIFPGGEAPTAQSQALGTGNAPLPSLTNHPTSGIVPGTTGDQSSIFGLGNDYSGTQSFPEADIIPNRSTVNANFQEYTWRVRGGNGLGPTGSPGFATADGWSQFAPQYSQGVQFNVNTTGYSNISMHFDWNYGGIGDKQPQYSPDGGSTWINVGPIIQGYGKDYAGITTTTDPTGITVNLQGIAAANNNPNFQFRLATAYDPNLPMITDGNLLDPTMHGQFGSAGFSANGQDAIQGLVLSFNDTSDFTLSFNGQTSPVISNYLATDPNNTNGQMTANIQAALNTLLGAGNATVVENNFSPIEYRIEFKGAMADLAEPNMTVSDPNYSVATWDNGTIANTTTTAAVSLTAATPTNITVASLPSTFAAGETITIGTVNCLVNSITPGTKTMNVTPATSSSGAFAIGTLVKLNPTTATSVATTFTANTALNVSVATSSPFAAGETVQIGTADFLINSVGNGTLNVTSPTSGFLAGGSTVTQLGIGIYNDADAGSWALGNISFNGDTVGGTPAVTSQPTSVTVAGGTSAQFTSTDYSEASPNSVQWQVSTNGGTSWSNVSTSNTTGGSTLYGTTLLAGVAGSGTNSSTQLQLAAGTFNTTANFYVGDSVTFTPGVGAGESAAVTASSTTGVLTFAAQTTPPAAGTTNYVVTAPVTSTGAFTAVLSFQANASLADNGDQFRAVFTNSSGSNNSLAATLTVVAPTAPAVTIQPFNASVQQGTPAIFTATAIGSPVPTIQWQISSDGGAAWLNLADSSTVLGSSTNTLTFTTSNDLTENGDQFRAVFTNQVAATNSNAVTLTVLSPENVLTDWNFAGHPTGGTGANDVQTMTATATIGSYQLVFEGNTTATLAFNASVSSIQNALSALPNIGTGNVAVTGTPSSAVIAFQGNLADTAEQPLTVANLGENAVNTIAHTTTGVASVFDNNPVPTDGLLGSTVGGVYAGVGTLTGIGMNLAYNPTDPATGTSGTGAMQADDVTNTPGALNPTFNENTFRIRSGPTPATGGTPANGWSNLLPQYTQGLEAMVPTTGYANVYVTLDWYSTTSGELDAQPQYTVSGNTLNITGESLLTATASNNGVATLTYTPVTGGFIPAVGDNIIISGLGDTFNGTAEVTAATATTFSYVDNAVTTTNQQTQTSSLTGSGYDPTWLNYGPQVQAVSNDFYGATATGGPIPLVVDTSNIAAANNNPNFGVRLVNAYNYILSNTQTLTLNDTANFKLTFGNQTTSSIAYTGNFTQEVLNIQAALGALTNVGSTNVTVSDPGSDNVFTIAFDNALGNAVQPKLVSSDSFDGVEQTNQYANALLTSTGPAPYNGNKGNWRFDNIQIHGTEPESLSAANYAVNETDGTATITVNRTGSTAIPVTVNYATSDGTAHAGTDYTTTSGTLTIPLNESGATFTVPLIDVATSAGTRLFNITLSSPSTTADVVAPSTATITITDNAGVALPAWLASGSAATWNAGTKTLTVTGAATIIADPGTDSPNIVETTSAAQLSIHPTTADQDIHVGGFALSNGAGIDMVSVGEGRTHSNHNVLVVGTLNGSAPTFSIDSSSKFNLEDNDLIIHSGDYASVAALAAIGRNVAPGGLLDGTWNGNGLTSSTAASVDASAGFEKVSLAVVRNDQLLFGAFNSWQVGSASETLASEDVIVKYTYTGDFALEGNVGDDAATIFGFSYDGGISHNNTWANGDLNGDGVINSDDATIFGFIYGNGVSSGDPVL
jgi:hypothetical protein